MNLKNIVEIVDSEAMCKWKMTVPCRDYPPGHAALGALAEGGSLVFDDPLQVLQCTATLLHGSCMDTKDTTQESVLSQIHKGNRHLNQRPQHSPAKKRS